MKTESVSSVLGLVGLTLSRVRPDLALAGSPERCLDRTVVEDAEGRHWIVETHDRRQAARKQEIAAAASSLARRLPEIKPWLEFAPGRFVGESEGTAWQVSPFVSGIPLERPDYAFEAWRGDALADLLIRFRTAASGLSGGGEAAPLSLADFVRRLLAALRERERPLLERVHPAALHLERSLFPKLGTIPLAFSHGDFHPLNIIWSATGIMALIDLEFCGIRPETYDAALLVGCLGMEDPRCLTGDLVKSLLRRLRAEAGYADEAWEAFLDLVLALRFAWLSDWLRREDREMVDLEAVYISLLLRNREALGKALG